MVTVRIWNFCVVLPGWVLVCAGFGQPLEWAEFPLIVACFVVLSFVLAIVQFVTPFLKKGVPALYVSAWYVIGGLIFTTLAYPVGNLAPQMLPGAIGAAFSGLWIHDAVGLYVTPLALAIAYFVIPVSAGRPIYSHFLSMIGFWLLFFVYPLNGTHHYVFSSIPMDAQKGAIAASAYLGMDVILVVTNLLLSLRGGARKVWRDTPLLFVWTGVVIYLLVSLQGSLQAAMPVNRFIHFSDWVIGHSHLAMLGFAGLIAAGGSPMFGSIHRGSLFRACDPVELLVANSRACSHGGGLTLAGLVEGHYWQTHLPWTASIVAASTDEHHRIGKRSAEPQKGMGDQLVYCVVPPDVLAHRIQFTLRVKERGGMEPACTLKNILPLPQCMRKPMDPSDINLETVWWKSRASVRRKRLQ
jgi:Cytochrome C and Quinol oxidase polypeptide I